MNKEQTELLKRIAITMKIFLFIILLSIPTVVKADCFCACINGANQKVCSNAYEYHFCPYQYCPQF